MKTIQDIVVGLFLVGNVLFTAHCAQAQDAKTLVVGTAILDVTVKQGHSDICTRVTQDILQCTRFEVGKATKELTCQVTKQGLVCR